MDKPNLQTDPEKWASVLGELASESGPVRGVCVPSLINKPAAVTNIDVGGMLSRNQSDKESLRSLALVPLCQHTETGYWCVAMFEGKPDKLMDGDPDANVRGSLALSLMENTPLIVFGDFSLLFAECGNNKQGEPTWKALATMPLDMARDMALQFNTAEGFAAGPFVSAAQQFGVDLGRISKAVFKGYDWTAVARRESLMSILGGTSGSDDGIGDWSNAGVWAVEDE